MKMCLKWMVIWLVGVGSVISEEVLASYDGDNLENASQEWKEGSYSATFTNSIDEKGTAFLELQSKADEDDRMQAYKAGFSEGFLTRDLIFLHWRNTVEKTCDDKAELCERANKFIAINIKWMEKEARRQEHYSYWYQINLILRQLEGLTDGYNNATKNGDKKMTFHELFWLNTAGDLGDLFAAIGTPEEKAKHPEWFNGSYEHCSVLIKPLSNQADLYFSHVTWTSYQAMLRVMKMYSLSFHETKTGKLVNGARVSMSSYPGMLSSLDDFYLLSSGLAVTETTNENFNSALWTNVKPVGQVFTWIRGMVANRLASSGESWCRLFRKYNSGTYNNQWMVLDFNKFSKYGSLQPATLWVLEQLPGYVRMEDKTEHLRKNGYWASYNLPYFEDVFKMTDTPAMVKKYGNLYSHSEAPRAKIFQRDHVKVNDLQSMIKLMRYNDYQHDPLSRCDCDPPYSADLAISARCDLNPKNGTYPIALLGHRSHGATDMKLVSADRIGSQGFVVISGPTYDPLPPFVWSQTDFKNDCPHYGHPDEWRFPAIDIKWSSIEENYLV